MPRIFLLLVLTFIYPHALCAEIQGLWDHYLHIYDSKKADDFATENINFHVIGEFENYPYDLEHQSWPYKKISYEIIAASKTDLSRLIYGLALYVKDIDVAISLKHFENGVLGFHYSIDQILNWANDIQNGKINFKSPGEIVFLNLLVQDKLIHLHKGMWKSATSVKHVIGASESKNRSLLLNLTHERIHIFWDEDIEFKKDIEKKWLSLNSDEQDLVLKSLKMYNKENIHQIIEEWGVRSHENRPPWN